MENGKKNYGLSFIRYHKVSYYPWNIVEQNPIRMLPLANTIKFCPAAWQNLFSSKHLSENYVFHKLLFFITVYFKQIILWKFHLEVYYFF